MTEVIITDHALVRWLERARGIDLELLRKQLAEIAQPYVDLKVKHACVGGVWLVFHENKLVTVTPDRPDVASLVRNDKLGSNGTHVRTEEKPHWKCRARKRRNK